MIPFLDAILEPALWWAADWSLRWAALLAATAVMLWIVRPRRAALRQLVLLVVLAAGLLLPFAPRWGEGWDSAATQSVADVRSHAPRGNEERLPPSSALSSPARPPSSLPRSAWERTSGRSAARPVEELDATQSVGHGRSHAERGNEKMENRRLIILGLVSCWISAVAYQLMRCFCGWIFLRRLRREAVEATGTTAHLFVSCRAELQVRSAVRLSAHPHVRSPILLGLWQPLIVVPPDWPERSAETQRAALLHELAHVRRRDHWLAPLLETVRIVFFFHPFVRWLLARLEQERELLCDEMVVCRGIDPRDYARLLVEFARSSGRLAWPAVALPMGRRRTVRGRIHHLLEEDMERWIRPLSLRWAVVLGAVLLALMLGMASYQVLAVEKQKPDPAPDEEKSKPAALKQGEQKADAKKPSGDSIKREDLRYGGKDFYQWRRELLTELKPSIRADGLVALGTFGANGFGPEATQAILDMMRGYDPGIENARKIDSKVVEAGYAAILKIRAAAVPALAEAVNNDNRNVRIFAIEVLGRMDGDARRSALPALLQACKNDERETRSSAITVVGYIGRGTKEVIAALIEALKDNADGVRGAAAGALGNLGEASKPAIPALLKALSDKQNWVRISAVQALGQIGARAKAVTAVIRLLQDEDDGVRQNAMQYLQKLKPEEFTEAVPALIAAMKNPKFEEWAIGRLGEIGPGAKEAMPALNELLRSENANERSWAIRALKKISPEDKR